MVLERGSRQVKIVKPNLKGIAMSAVRKLVLSTSALFLAFSGLFLANATASADSHVATGMGCQEQDWNSPCA